LALGSWPLQAPRFTGWIFRPECGSCAELIAVALHLLLGSDFEQIANDGVVQRV